MWLRKFIDHFVQSLHTHPGADYRPCPVAPGVPGHTTMLPKSWQSKVYVCLGDDIAWQSSQRDTIYRPLLDTSKIYRRSFLSGPFWVKVSDDDGLTTGTEFTCSNPLCENCQLTANSSKLKYPPEQLGILIYSKTLMIMQIKPCYPDKH